MRRLDSLTLLSIACNCFTLSLSSLSCSAILVAPATASFGAAAASFVLSTTLLTLALIESRRAVVVFDAKPFIMPAAPVASC